MNMIDWHMKIYPIRDQHVILNYPPAVMPHYGKKVPGEETFRLYIDSCFPTWWKPEDKPIMLIRESCFP